jgi:hypothetical protein
MTMTKIAETGSGSGSTPIFHGSETLVCCLALASEEKRKERTRASSFTLGSILPCAQLGITLVLEYKQLFQLWACCSLFISD